VTSSLTLVAFVSLSKTLHCSRGPSPPSSHRRAREGRSARAGWSRTPLLGLSKDRPSIDIRTECPLPTAIRFRLQPRRAPALAVADLHPEGRRPALRCLRPEAATLRTRSALVVPPDYGGLLHSVPCRSVAPCSQSWGSPRFRAEVRHSSHGPRSRKNRSVTRHRTIESSPRRVHPSERSPCRQPCRVTAAHALSPLSTATRQVYFRERKDTRQRDQVLSTSRPCSTGKSVAPPGRCRPAAARCSLGLLDPPEKRRLSIHA
jgi:hypothetical protein